MCIRVFLVPKLSIYWIFIRIGHLWTSLDNFMHCIEKYGAISEGTSLRIISSGAKCRRPRVHSPMDAIYPLYPPVGWWLYYPLCWELSEFIAFESTWIQWFTMIYSNHQISSHGTTNETAKASDATLKGYPLVDANMREPWQFAWRMPRCNPWCWKIYLHQNPQNDPVWQVNLPAPWSIWDICCSAIWNAVDDVEICWDFAS